MRREKEKKETKVVEEQKSRANNVKGKGKRGEKKEMG